jgi:hypothetical protein
VVTKSLKPLPQHAYLSGMTEPLAAAQIRSRHREMGQPMPRVFTRTAWWRFARDRRRRYLARLPETPSNEQAALVESLVRLEWSSLAAHAEGGLAGFREAREHRRLFQRLLADFERTLAKPAGKERPGAALDAHLAMLRERREGAA